MQVIQLCMRLWQREGSGWRCSSSNTRQSCKTRGSVCFLVAFKLPILTTVKLLLQRQALLCTREGLLIVICIAVEYFPCQKACEQLLFLTSNISVDWAISQGQDDGEGIASRLETRLLWLVYSFISHSLFSTSTLLIATLRSGGVMIKSSFHPFRNLGKRPVTVTFVQTTPLQETWVCMEELVDDHDSPVKNIRLRYACYFLKR